MQIANVIVRLAKCKFEAFVYFWLMKKFITSNRRAIKKHAIIWENEYFQRT